jgi:hypothetical protein
VVTKSMSSIVTGAAAGAILFVVANNTPYITNQKGFPP